MLRFTPTEDFTNTDSHGVTHAYVKGLGYSVRPGNKELAKYVETWRAEGKIEVRHVPDARVSGAGEVSAPVGAKVERKKSWLSRILRPFGTA